jgi:hypothetical protein
VIAQKDIINGEFELIIDRKYVEFEQQNNTINNLQIIIDKKKRELAQTNKTKLLTQTFEYLRYFCRETHLILENRSNYL